LLSKRRIKKPLAIFILFLISFSLIISIFYYTYVKNHPVNPSEFPIINIKSEDKIDSNTKFTDCTFELDTKGESKDVGPINAEIKLRGSFNAQMPKKEYRIKLSDQIELLEMPEENDWQLFAMFMDITHLRIKLSFDLYRELLATDPTAILPDSRYVCLYINDDFQGLYLLAQRNNRRLFGLDDAQNTINSSLIFQAGTRSTDFKDYDDNTWDQDWPNEYEGYYIMNAIMINLVSFIRDAPDVIFFDNKSGIFTIFDKLNLIDFFLFNFFILHKDFWANNYYLVRNTNPNKFFLVPWDFDQSFGQFLTREYDSDENSEQEIFSRNYLFYRLLINDNFRQECKKRWFELRETIFTEEIILDLISEYYSEIKDVLYLDTEMWYPMLFGENWKKETLDLKIKALYEWIPNRLSFCDLYFSNY
jgi:spore coat protein CotH